MRIQLSRQQLEWQGVARRVASEILAPRAAQIDRDGSFPRENFDAFAKAGLMALPVREELGGPGADVLTCALVTEQLAQACASSALCYHMHIAAASLIAALAEGEQVDRFVMPILRGNHICTYAISEPESGSRWWHMQSHADKEGSEYIIDSFKSFATSAGEADTYVIPLRAMATSPHHQLSIFAIGKDVPNFTPVGKWDAMGMRGNSSTPIHFHKCRIPDLNRLGEAAMGLPLLMAYGLPIYQVGLASVYVGLAQAAFDFSVSHVTKRVHADTGLPLSSVETVQLYIAAMKLRIDEARLFVMESARYIDRMADEHEDLVEVIEDDDFLQTIAEVKVVACEAATFVADKAVQVCGGTGYSRKHPIERYYRDARAGSIMGPADDILRVLIGKRALGLPYPWE